MINDALGNGSGLEEVLQSQTVPPSLVKNIIKSTWEAVTEDDLTLLEKAARGNENFPLSALIQGLFRSTNDTIHVVTTNYDRVVEYSTDTAGFIHTTGFSPGLIRYWEGTGSTSIRRGNHKARTVQIWKVHGSLDWFSDGESQAISLPLSAHLPSGFVPLIVTPGISKYERTHDEPFRSAIQGADTALGEATGYLCIGYGFRDTHIQPKLIERCRRRNVPIVVLAKTLTDEAKRFLTRNAGAAYLAMEKHEQGTRVFTSETPSGEVILNQDLWPFPNFNELVL